MGVLFDFLQKNQIEKASTLPLVHSTEAYHLKKIIRTGELKTSPCTVFKNENLAYFFVGRPAFKRELGKEAEYWELPVCFITQFDAVKPKRVFPFDSGAFRSHRYPSFISMMELDEFEVGNDPLAISKMIGTFFASPRDYFFLKARAKDQFESKFDVDTLEEEIKALHKLITFKSTKFDDRRFAIELQSEQSVKLDKVLAVIMPESYIESKELTTHIENNLHAKIITYSVFPLRKEYYYYSIYDKVEHFLRHERYFNV